MTLLRPRAVRSFAALVVGLSACVASGQEAVRLVESFDPGHNYHAEVRVNLSGRLAMPAAERGKPPQVVNLTGASRVVYDERVLPPDEPNTRKAARVYREVDFRRVVGAATQDAGIRPSVRRMVIIKDGPRRAPFSPDGPLTWGEIDVVRTDVFLPAAVPGLLPAGPVKPGDRWAVSPAAVAELTDMEKVDEGGLAVELVAVTSVDGKRLARLRISGTVRGVNEDGPNRQKIDGTAYFDLGAGFLTYLSVKGAHDLLDGGGQTVGTIEGQFVLTRSAGGKPADLSDASLRGLDLRPTAGNSALLYDNPDLGVRFLYPRSWRVGAVQGKQVTLDHARGGAGVLVTLEPADKIPAPDDYLAETAAFLRKEKATITATERPAAVRPAPARLDRFAFDAEIGGEKLRMEYAVLRQEGGGATVAVRLPAAAAAELRAEADRIVRSLAITKTLK